MSCFSNCLVLVLLQLFVFVTVVECFGVMIEDGHVQVSKSSIATVSCQVEPVEPIASCQFRVWYVARREQGALLEVNTREDNVQVENPVDSFTADLIGGEGFFELGTCAVTLKAVTGDQLVVGCKVTTLSNRSAIQTTTLVYTEDTLLSLSHELQDDVMLVDPGSSVDVLVRTQEGSSLTRCSTTLVSQDSLDILPGNLNNNNLVVKQAHPGTANRRYSSFGRTLAQGECGFTINNVTEQDSGVFFVKAEEGDGSSGVKAFTLIVAKQSPPSLVLTASRDTEQYVDGEVISLTCTASRVHQLAARWRWWSLNVGSQGQSVKVEGWRWPWEVAVVSQSVTLQLDWSLDGANLTCSLYNSTVYKVIRIDPNSIRPVTTTEPTPGLVQPGAGGHLGDVSLKSTSTPINELLMETSRAGISKAVLAGVVSVLLALGVAVAVLLIAYCKKQYCFQEVQVEPLTEEEPGVTEEEPGVMEGEPGARQELTVRWSEVQAAEEVTQAHQGPDTEDQELTEHQQERLVALV